jgi:hypothetical protein
MSASAPDAAGRPATDRTEADGLFAVRTVSRGGGRWAGNMIDGDIWLSNFAIALANLDIMCMNS